MSLDGSSKVCMFYVPIRVRFLEQRIGVVTSVQLFFLFDSVISVKIGLTGDWPIAPYLMLRLPIIAFRLKSRISG